MKHAKLSPEQVKTIIMRAEADETHRSIAEDFDVSPQRVGQIVKAHRKKMVNAGAKPGPTPSDILEMSTEQLTNAYRSELKNLREILDKIDVQEKDVGDLQDSIRANSDRLRATDSASLKKNIQASILAARGHITAIEDDVSISLSAQVSLERLSFIVGEFTRRGKRIPRRNVYL